MLFFFTSGLIGIYLGSRHFFVCQSSTTALKIVQAIDLGILDHLNITIDLSLLLGTALQVFLVNRYLT